MRADEALTYEPAACWQRLQAAKSEFFFEDLDQLMKARHRQFLEELMGSDLLTSWNHGGPKNS
jgi:hypothetical protein